MIRAVFFDLDGTLLNREKSVRLFIYDQHKRLYNFLNHIQVDLYAKRFLELEDKGYVWKDKVYDRLVKEFNIKGITSQQLLQDYLDFFQYYCLPFNHLHETLKALQDKNIKLGIISNGYGAFQMNNIKALKIDTYFQSILISEFEGIKKPAFDIFIKGLSQLSVDAKQSMFVGDHPKNDIEAPSKLGMKTVWVRNNHFSNVNADYTIDDLLEIKDIVLS